MVKMTSSEYQAALKKIGVSYLSGVDTSAKLALNGKHGVVTTCLYLLPWNQSGYQVCPGGEHCKDFCLNGSGHNKGDILSRGVEGSRINRARMKKTRLFFEDRELFMRVLIYEIERAMNYAKRREMEYSIRLNCTSDLSPEAFKIDGKNILELYPNVPIYDYTKVATRYRLVEKYPNYSLTFSYDGFNWDTCVDFLRRGINVAVVFESKEKPISFRGYPIIDMTKSDLRYKDPRNINGDGFIGFLEFHRPASLYKGGRYERPNTPFVIREDDPDVLYAFKTPKSDELGE